MCEYQAGKVECRDGYLWDTAQVEFDLDDHILPCPKCNTAKYLQNAKDYAENVMFSANNNETWTGVSYWEHALKTAKQLNEPVTDITLVRIGVVNAIYDDPSKEKPFLTRVFRY